MNAAAFVDLAERCMVATEASPQLDALIWCALRGKKLADFWKQEYVYGADAWRLAFTEPPKRTRIANKRDTPAYTGSIDAATALIPEGWNWMAGNRNQPKARAYVNNGEPHFEGIAASRNPRLLWFEVVAATPALALTAACLQARAASAAGARSGETREAGLDPKDARAAREEGDAQPTEIKDQS